MKQSRLWKLPRRANPEKWRLVVVRDALGVKALNTLFRKGWYLMDIEMDDLPFLAFEVPLEGERPQKNRRPDPFIPFPEEPDRTLLLILTKGTIHRQRALMLDLDEKGYRDFARYEEQLARESDGWDILQIFSLENRHHIAILEKPSPPSP